MLIRDVSVKSNGQLKKGRDIRISGERIAEVGEGLSQERDEYVIDGRGKLAITGLVNSHTHLAMTLLRGYADDMQLDRWLEEKIWPIEARLTAKDISCGVKLGCLEMIRTGTTCFCDMYLFSDEVASATKEMGLRAVVSHGVFDINPAMLRQAEPFLRRWKDDDLIMPSIGPHSIYTCSKETLLASKDLAERYGVTIHMHVSETKKEVKDSIRERGCSPVEYIRSLGMVSPRLLAVHCTWVSPRDLSILASEGSTAVHCPVSNLKLALGVAPVSSMVYAGIRVCLGTDGASSNNSLNLFEDMKVASLMSSSKSRRRKPLSDRDIYQMATENAYSAFSLPLSIQSGSPADLVLIDMRSPWYCPKASILSHLVHRAHLRVDTTIVNGRVLMSEGIIPGEKEIIQEAQERYERLCA